jgi:3-hydroxyacyl-CoA dehydrogenase/enoyl-CoA hydratase/3-hydroxybutyryl-CoA epimerase
MMSSSAAPPALRQFQVECRNNGVVHFIFDAPGRTMNVLSNEAIHELGAFARWLTVADVRGAVISSGKTSAFCAGADLNELGVAYDMIVNTPAPLRFNKAFDHFFPLSAAIRALECSGKPVAAAIGGLALGGGCELALGAHHRVLADTPAAALGLPESLVGLLPGAGGTQRLPRLIGLEAALPVLLDGGRLAGPAAVEAGLVHELVAPGREIVAAEQWVLGGPGATQPWDRDDWTARSCAEIGAIVGERRRAVLSATLGHYPAPLAILDCLEFGLPQCFDGAIRSEMAIFSHLIQRAEPRNMIQSLFLGKADYDRKAKRGELPACASRVVSAVRAELSKFTDQTPLLAMLGFSGLCASCQSPVRTRASGGYWLDGADPSTKAARALLEQICASVAPLAAGLSEEDRRLADYAAIREAGFPAYLGGPFAFRARGLC